MQQVIGSTFCNDRMLYKEGAFCLTNIIYTTDMQTLKSLFDIESSNIIKSLAHCLAREHSDGIKDAKLMMNLLEAVDRVLLLDSHYTAPNQHYDKKVVEMAEFEGLDSSLEDISDSQN